MVSVVGVLTWQERGNCFGQPDTFATNNARAVTMLRDYCPTCPVKDECLDLGKEMVLTNGGLERVYGVWGGVFFGGTSGPSWRKNADVARDLRRGYSDPAEFDKQWGGRR